MTATTYEELTSIIDSANLLLRDVTILLPANTTISLPSRQTLRFGAEAYSFSDLVSVSSSAEVRP